MSYARFLLHAGVCMCLLAGTHFSSAALAGTLNLPNVPLFLQSTVEPNIFLIIDDSESMQADVATRDASHGGRWTGSQPDGSNPSEAGSVTHTDLDGDGVADCTFFSSDLTLGPTLYGYSYIADFGQNIYGAPCDTADDRAWRIRNYQFNSLYYNPHRTYEPWAGTRSNGAPMFTNMPITAAQANPAMGVASETINLLRDSAILQSDGTRRDVGGFRYYIWNDTSNPGVFDNSDAREEHRIADEPSQWTNFANWFSYYRSRLLTAKALFGNFIQSASGVRIGLATLNSAAGQPNRVLTTPLLSVDNPANKRVLLENLYRVVNFGDTPLPPTFYQVGRYFEAGVSSSLFDDLNATAPSAACQQNFALVMTDGIYTSSPSDLPAVVFNADSDRSSDFDHDPASAGPGPHADPPAQSDRSLADVAMYFYERDLDPDAADHVPIILGIDEARHQHLVPYFITFAVGSGSLQGIPAETPESDQWPAHLFSGAFRLDDLRHAAYNGRGRFFETASFEELNDAIQTAFADVGEHVTSSVASIAADAGVTGTDTQVFQARFNSADWSGELVASQLSSSDALVESWRASTQLDAQDFDTGRTILTYHPTLRDGISFRWANLSSSQQQALLFDATNPSSPTSTEENRGRARLEYLRGRRDGEARLSGFRIRATVLGDIVHSDPLFIGPPAFPESIGATPAEQSAYVTFRRSHASRAGMVAVGANDGFLHIFSASSGDELLAYMPNAVFGNAGRLSERSYNGDHRYYVDGSPTVGDVLLEGSWRTVLVGGLRGGGQGYFALDVTDPARFDESNARELVLWEFTAADDSDLGNTFSQPNIVRLPHGQWAAVFGNGPNSASNRTVLFIVNMAGPGADGVWERGTDYYKIDVTSSSQVNPLAPTGLSTPAVIDIDGDFTADYVIAGDFQGNLWQFNVTSASPTGWASSYGTTASPLPLFVATDGTNRQPITTRPEIGAHPVATDSGFIVYFGTGQYIEADDVADTALQSFYALGVSNPSASSAPGYGRGSTLLRQQILQEQSQSVTLPSGASVQRGVRLLSNETINWTTDLGWYIDLVSPGSSNTGERQVSNAVLRNGRIIFATILPDNTPCEAGGSGWLMELDAFTGGRLNFVGFDLNQDGKFTSDDLVRIASGLTGEGTDVSPSGIQSEVGLIGTPTILPAGLLAGSSGEGKILSGSSGAATQLVYENPGPGRGRQTWQQILLH